MKASFRVRTLSLVMIFALVSAVVNAAEYYVVIGAFAHESNAKRFTATVRNFLEDVTYTYNESRNLYYVTALRTTQKEDARNWSLYLRNEKGFKDAWVLAYEAERQREQIQVAADATNIRQTESVYHLTSNRSVAAPAAEEKDAGSSSASSAASVNVAWSEANGVSFIGNISNPDDFSKQVPASMANMFTFVVEDEKGNSIPAEVMLVNFGKVKKVATIETGENIAVKKTKPEQMVTFVCDKLGYKQVIKVFNMDHLSRSRDIWKNENGVWEVRIRLKKMEEHDFAFMNKTLFYKDAAVLESSSQKELDELVNMMKSNLGYKIVLHSHCNPGSRREIKLPNADGNYFDVSATVEKSGSDKLLTKARGEVVRDYLVANGIDKKRVEVVAWGSSELIVSATSPDAYINERIEVEVAK